MTDDWDESDETTDSIPCPNCGQWIYDEAQRCPHCGEYVVEDHRFWSDKPRWKQTMFTTVVILVIISFLLPAIIGLLAILNPNQ